MQKSDPKFVNGDLGISPGFRRLLIRCGLCTESSLKKLDPKISLRSGLLEALAAEKPGTTIDTLLEVLSRDLGIPATSLPVYQTAKFVVTLPQNELIDNPSMKRLLYVPYAKNQNELVIAVADPLDIGVLQHLEFVLQRKPKLALATAESILSCIEHLDQLAGSTSFEELDRECRGGDSADEESQAVADPIAELSEEVGSATQPVVRFVNQIISEAAKSRASDIHLEPGRNEMEVRFRVDGVMTEQLKIPKKLQPYITTRIKIMSGMNITEKRRPQDGRLRAKLPSNQEVDIRSSTVPTPFGEKVVLRLLHSSNAELRLDRIGLDEATLTIFRDTLKARERMVLVCGPTGSGKTTTLYAALSELNTGTNNIITLEDPIEIRIPGITQIQVDTKIGMTFANGLRSVLRQDPDIVLLGEIRDLETAQIAFQAAQTGHLVLSTVHTNSAAGAITRLRDIGLEPYMIASALGGVLAQRLARKLCRSCARPDKQSPVPGLMLAVGCPECGNNGYKGRTGIYSLIDVSTEVRELIRDGASEAEIEAAAEIDGFKDLIRSCAALCVAGITSVDEASRTLGVAAEELMAHIVDAPKAKKKTGTPLPVVDVMIVDDDRDIREVIKSVLETTSISVVAAENGIDALAILERVRPRLILSDLIMPQLDGISFLKRLKQDADHSSIPVVILSGSDQEDNQVEGINEGAEDFISKAASPTLLLAKVKRVLDRVD